MTRLCVSIMVRDVSDARRDIALAAEAGADIVELRIDRLGVDFNEAEVHSLLVGAPVPCIVTCRPEWEGGSCELPESDRRKYLTIFAGNWNAAYVDFELAAVRRMAPGVAPRTARSGLIVSAHDFVGRPTRLANLVAELINHPADVAKVVWTARTIRDNLEVFELLQQRQKPMIALCMGEAGLISRILARKFGGFLTFASLTEESQTAPGQISIHDMKRLYRWDAIGAETKVYGVVASPVAHSMSPAIHNAAFTETGYNGVYLPMLVNAGYESFKAFMESFLAFEPLHLSGLSITLPHKENALRYLREKGSEIDPLALQIGAANTIVIDRANGQLKLRGLNTDYGAILDSITDRLRISREQLADYRVAVIGAGGTGRTAVAALAHYGATVVVYNRTFERAEALAQEFNGRSGKVVAARMEKLCDSCCHIFINTTSVGMHPNVDQSPLGDQPPPFTDQHVVFDTIYNPPKTRFLQAAESAGANTIGGIEMFVRQAAAQFEAWTGRPAPVETMRRVVEERLEMKTRMEDGR